METIKQQNRATSYGCMAAGKSPWARA